MFWSTSKVVNAIPEKQNFIQSCNSVKVVDIVIWPLAGSNDLNKPDGRMVARSHAPENEFWQVGKVDSAPVPT